MPPSRVAKASGMSSRAGLVPARRLAPDTAGSSTDAAAMLFMNSDEAGAGQHHDDHQPPFTAAARRRSRRSPTRCVAPVRSSPAARMKMAKMVITAERLNPENASSTVSTPETPSATTTSSATRSARTRSLRKRTIAEPRMTKVTRREETMGCDNVLQKAGSLTWPPSSS